MVFLFGITFLLMSSEDFDIDFRPLREDELTPEILAMAEEARKTSVEDLINI